MPPPYSRLCDIILSPCMISSLYFPPAVTPASGAVLSSQHILRIRMPRGSSPINQQLISPVRGAGRAALANSVFHNTVYTSLACSMFLQEALLFFYNLCNH